MTCCCKCGRAGRLQLFFIVVLRFYFLPLHEPKKYREFCGCGRRCPGAGNLPSAPAARYGVFYGLSNVLMQMLVHGAASVAFIVVLRTDFFSRGNTNIRKIDRRGRHALAEKSFPRPHPPSILCPAVCVIRLNIFESMGRPLSIFLP